MRESYCSEKRKAKNEKRRGEARAVRPFRFSFFVSDRRDQLLSLVLRRRRPRPPAHRRAAVGEAGVAVVTLPVRGHVLAEVLEDEAGAALRALTVAHHRL